MTKQEYRRALAYFGLTQRQASDLFNTHDRTGRRWATVEGTVPYYIALLFELMFRHNIKLDELEHIRLKYLNKNKKD